MNAPEPLRAPRPQPATGCASSDVSVTYRSGTDRARGRELRDARAARSPRWSG